MGRPRSARAPSPAALHGLVALLPLLAACGPETADAPAGGPPFAVEDSARVQVATNRVAMGDVPAWSVPAEPEAVIGGEGAATSRPLHRVRAALTLPDGAVTILNQGSDEVLVFEPDGSFRLAMGGTGEGPGELDDPQRMLLADGTVHVWDPSLRRVTMFGPDGRLKRTLEIDGLPGRAQLLAVLDDGSFVLEERGYPAGAPGGPDSFGELRLTLYRVAADRAAVDTLPEVPAGVRGWVSFPDVGPTDQPERYGPSTLTAPGPDGYWVGLARDHEVALHSPPGEVRRIVRWNGPDPTPSSRDLDRIREYEDGAVAASGDPRLRETYARWPVAERFATYDALVPDRAGGFWVRLHRFEPARAVLSTPARLEGPATWLAFDDEGRLSGRVTLPYGLTLLEVGGSHLLALHRDALDVETVRRFALRRGRERGP